MADTPSASAPIGWSATALAPRPTRDRFARMLVAFRARRGLTQQGIARLLGCSVRTLQNWEQARAMPRGVGLTAVLALVAESPADHAAPPGPPTAADEKARDDAEPPLATHLL